MDPVPITGASLGLMTHLALLPLPCGQKHPGKVFLQESKANINLEYVTQATVTMNSTKLRTTFSNSSLKLCNKSSGEMRLFHKLLAYIGSFLARLLQLIKDRNTMVIINPSLFSFSFKKGRSETLRLGIFFFNFVCLQLMPLAL